MHPERDRALTELWGLLFIAILICTAAIIIIAASGGLASSLLQKPPVFAVRASVISPFPGKNAICLYHIKGDPVALADPSAAGSSAGVVFTLEDPQGEKISVSPAPGMATNPWAPGGTVIIYFDGSRFWAAENFTPLSVRNGSGGIAGLPPGIWIVYITDRQTQVVVNSLAVTA